MLCGNCKKNQATKTYERVKKGKPSVEYYCMDCYAQLFLTENGQDLSVCPYCGTTAEEVSLRNLVGCAKCYFTLEKTLYPIITKFQGKKVHEGKKPLGGEEERLQRRRREIEVIENKLLEEGDYKGAQEYKRKRESLIGEGGDFVWDSRNLSKQS